MTTDKKVGRRTLSLLELATDLQNVNDPQRQWAGVLWAARYTSLWAFLATPGDRASHRAGAPSLKQRLCRAAPSHRAR